MGRLLMAGIFVLSFCRAASQEAPAALAEDVEAQVAEEEVPDGEEGTVGEGRLSDYLDDLFHLYDDPIDLNAATRDELARLNSLTDLQVFYKLKLKKEKQLSLMFNVYNIIDLSLELSEKVFREGRRSLETTYPRGLIAGVEFYF